MTITDRIKNFKTFFKEVYVELKKVNWLSRNEVLRYTLIVVVVTVVVAAFLGGLDYLFSTALRQFIFK